MCKPIKVPGIFYATAYLGELKSTNGKKERLPLEQLHIKYPMISETAWHIYDDIAVKEISRTDEVVVVQTVTVPEVDKFIKHLDDLQR